MKYLVSACLAGESCCYDGTDCADPLIQNLVQRGEALPVCPELLGGLGVPRSPCEIRGEKVLTREGEDVTEAFSCGSKAVLKMACRNSIPAAVLRNGCPSCGFGSVYDGSFSGKKISGQGVTAKVLSLSGLFLFNSDSFTFSDRTSLKKTKEGDFPELVEISRETFLVDSTANSPHSPGGPEGYDSILWHKEAARRGKFFTVFYQGEIAGGLFITLKPDRTGWINRVFVRNDLRGRGIGRRIFFLLEQKYSSIREWGLDTPDWAEHNQRFYESMGYRMTREIFSKEAGFSLMVLRKKMSIPTPEKVAESN